MRERPREHFISSNGLTVCVYEWPGEGTPILFAHATGFHARCWDMVIHQLAGRACFAMDLRGHGRTTKPVLPIRWQDLGRDVEGVVEGLGIRGALGVGHSGGGFAVAHAAGLFPGVFSQLLLVDPAIISRERRAVPRAPGTEHFALKRRNSWVSADEMFDRFRNRHPYSLWQEQAIRDYCDHALREMPDGSYALACPPEVEASVYSGAGSMDISDLIAKIEIPVRVLRARPPEARPEAPAMVDMSASPTAPDLATWFPHALDVPLPHLSHYIPMEAPEVVVEHVLAMLAALEATR